MFFTIVADTDAIEAIIVDGGMGGGMGGLIDSYWMRRSCSSSTIET